MSDHAAETLRERLQKLIPPRWRKPVYFAAVVFAVAVLILTGVSVDQINTTAAALVASIKDVGAALAGLAGVLALVNLSGGDDPEEPAT